MQHIVLLGATGVVGQAITTLLCQKPFSNCYQVSLLVRKKTALKLPAHFKTWQGDLNSIPAGLFPRAEHVVIHFARKQVDHDGSGYEKTNCLGTGHLLDHCRQNTRGIIYGSSLSVYGMWQQIKIDENTSPAPDTPLAVSRCQAENIIQTRLKNSCTGYYILRPRFIFGGQDQTLPALVQLSRQGKIPGSGRQKLMFIEVMDYARIILQLTGKFFQSKRPIRKILNVGYQDYFTMQELTGLITEVFPAGNKILYRYFPQAILKLARHIPLRALKKIVERQALIGLSHYALVERLQSEIGKAIITQNPRSILKKLLLKIKEEST